MNFERGRDPKEALQIGGIDIGKKYEETAGIGLRKWKEEEAGENEEEDAISKLMKEMTSLTGARHKLSEPISPKKSKAPIRR